MKKIENISAEQIQKFPEWVKKWTEIGLSTKDQDLDLAIESAVKLYSCIEKPSPRLTWKARSPLEATYMACFGLLFLDLYRKLTNTPKPLSIESFETLASNIWSKVSTELGEKYSNKIKPEVLEYVHGEVKGLFSGVEGGSDQTPKVPTSLKKQFKQILEKEYSNHTGGQFWAPYCAYITFFRDVMQWENKLLEQFAYWEQICIKAGWVWWHEDILVVAEKPVGIYRDNEGRLHNPTGPSIQYRDGFCLYNWHGVSIPKEWTNKDNGLTAEKALKWSNIEQRRPALEIFGWDNVLKELNVSVVDEDEDPQIGTLLEAEIEGRKEKFLRVMCGTGRVFSLPVPPTVNTALEANAWTFGFESNTVGQFLKPEIRT